MAESARTKQYKTIVLENEKSEGIEKVKNELGAWGFFRYLYSNAMLRLLGLNLIMALFAVSIYVLNMLSRQSITNAAAALPYANPFGLGIAPWGGLEEYRLAIVNEFTGQKAFWMLFAVPLLTVPVCGGFAVVRDAYWTGKIKLIKTFFKGVYETGLQVLPFTLIISGGLFGIHHAAVAMQTGPAWVSTVVQIVLYAVLALFALWTLLFAGVATLFKQSFVASIKSSLQLAVRYAVANIFAFIGTAALFAALLIPVSFINMLVIVVLLMFGFVFAGLVWMIHMMRMCGCTVTGAKAA